MAESLRGGVIGAGVFGGYHARQYARLPGVVLSGVFDLHADRAVELAMPLGGRAFQDLDSLLEAADVITVASPATVHAEQALAAIAAGKSVYVEKPIATRLADAKAVCAAAQAKGVVVACGHQERVAFQAMGLLDIPEQPVRLEALRHGPASPRSQDVSAVLDLMVHDIDLALSLSASSASPQVLTADGDWDGVRAEARFADGFTALFDVSRTAPARRRTMRLVYPSGEVEVDFVARTFRNTTPFRLNPEFAATPAGTDPLGVSVESFLDAARGASPRPAVTLDEAVRALELALAVDAGLALRP